MISVVVIAEGQDASREIANSLRRVATTKTCKDLIEMMIAKLHQ